MTSNDTNPTSSTSLGSEQTKPIIAVCGATGQQGGSVARTLLKQGKFAVRALTRNPEHELAQELASLGAEIVRADYEDIESLTEAFRGAYGVFGVTDYFEARDRVLPQGFNQVDAAVKNDVKHFVWSSFEQVRKDSSDFAGSVTEHLRNSGMPHTLFYCAAYYSTLFNFQYFSTKSGRWDCNFPCPSDAVFPLISEKDVGGWVVKAFLSPEEWIGKQLKPCTERMSPRECTQSLGELSGQPVFLHELSEEDFAAREGELNKDPHLRRIMRWLIKNGPTFYDIELGRRIFPEAQQWRQYVDEKLNSQPPPRRLSVSMSTSVNVTSE